MLGVPFYGRSFALNEPTNNRTKSTGGYGFKIAGPGASGEYTRDRGYLAYYEVCELVKKQRWTKWRDPFSGPYAFSAKQWVGYDDSHALLIKTSFIKQRQLAGAMIWAIDLDDFRGVCCGVKYPLLKTLNHGLRGYYTFSVKSLGCM